jgi:hypothetical protein
MSCATYNYTLWYGNCRGPQSHKNDHCMKQMQLNTHTHTHTHTQASKHTNSTHIIISMPYHCIHTCGAAAILVGCLFDCI